MERRGSPIMGILASLILLTGHPARSMFAPSIAGLGQGAASSAPPALKQELQSLAFFFGQWSCAGVFIRSGKPIHSQLSATSDLGGAWLLVRWDDLPPNSFHALGLWGFDKVGKQLTNYTFDNFGTSRRFTSPGLDGSTIVWTANKLTGTPSESEERFVFERKSETEFVYSWEVKTPQLNWETGDRLTCRK